MKTNFLKILRINQKVLPMNCLKKNLILYAPTILAKELFKTKDKKNIKFVNVINRGLHDLKDEIEKMSKEEIEI